MINQIFTLRINSTTLEPNRGDKFKEQFLDRLSDVGIPVAALTKLDYYHREEEKRFQFLESFKVHTKGLLDKSQIKAFKAFCRHNILFWYKTQEATSWKEFEESFK